MLLGTFLNTLSHVEGSNLFYATGKQSEKSFLRKGLSAFGKLIWSYIFI